MEREPNSDPEQELLRPEDARPDDEAEDLPEGPGVLPDTGHVVEEKGEEDGSEG